MRFAALCLAVLLVASPAFGDYEEEVQKAKGPNLIGIVVTTASGKTPGGQPYDPLEGVEVEIRGTELRTVTDTLGMFRFTVPPGDYMVVVKKQGIGMNSKRVQVTDGPRPAMVHIVLNPGEINITGGGTPVGPGTVYVAFASRGRPATPSTPGSVNPPGGPPLSTTRSYLGQIAMGADPFAIAGNNMLPPPNVNPGEYTTPINVNPNSLMILPPENPGKTGYVSLSVQPYWLAFNVAGTRLYVSNAARQIQVFDTINDHVLLHNIPTQGVITDLRLSPNGNYILASIMGATPGVLMLDTRTNAPERFVMTPPMRSGESGQPRGAVMNREGTRLFVITGTPSAGELVVLDTFTSQPLQALPVGANPTGIDLSPDGRFLYVVNSSAGSVSVVDAWTVQELVRIPVGVGPQKVAVSPDGSRVFVTNKGSNSVTVLDGMTHGVVATVPVGKEPVGVAFSPDGSRAFVTCKGAGTVVILDGRSGGILHQTTPLPNSAPYGVAVKP